MPTPKFFKKFSSKDKDSSGNSPAESPDATPKARTKEIPLEEAKIANPDVPQYSDTMKEAWSAAHAKLPQAQGAEKFLNKVGTLVALVLLTIDVAC